jgi:hypothetical protein
MASSKLINLAVVPALPGYRHTGGLDTTDELVTDTSSPPGYWSDIVAWRIETYERHDGTLYSFTTAVTVSGAEEEGYIECPNGVIDEPHSNIFENYACFIRHLREKADGADS